jgi:type IV pilus assembly protein PilN
MIRINLLPTSDVQRAADQRQQIATVGFLFAVAALVFIVLHSVQAARFATTQHHLTRVTDELQSIAGDFADVLKIQAQSKELEAKLKIISQLEARGAGPVRMMADLSSAVPDKLWLTEFTETNGTAKMTGFSVDEQTIADFLRRLSGSGYFKGVDLEETEQVTQDGVKQKKFTMKAQVNYAGPAPTPGAAPPRHAAATTDDATRLADRGRVQP